MFFASLLLLPLSMCLAAPSTTKDQLPFLTQPLLDSTQGTQLRADAPPLFASLAAVSPVDSLLLDTTQTVNPSSTATGQDTQISPANQQLSNLNLAGSVTNLVKAALGARKPSQDPANVDPLSGGVLPPNTFPNNFPNTIPGNFPTTIPGSYPNTIPGNSPNNIPGNFPNTIPGNFPNNIPGNFPNTIPGNFPNNIPGNFPNTIPGNFPNTIPGTFPNNIPGNYPNGGFPAPVPAPAPAKPNKNIFNPFSFLTSGLSGGNNGPFGMMSIRMTMKLMEALMEAFF